jgi:hypothetical protein
MKVQIIVTTHDRGDVEVEKRLPDTMSLTRLAPTDEIEELILAAARQAIAAYRGEEPQ